MRLDKLMETVKGLPQEFDLEEFIEKLIFVEKVEKGIQQLHDGQTVSQEKLKEIIKQW